MPSIRNSEPKDPNNVRVSFHGHVLPDFGPRWRARFGVDGNLAEALYEKCRDEQIDIYFVTNEPSYANFSTYPRIAQIVDEAIKSKNLEVAPLDNGSYVLSKNGKEIYLLSGLSQDVYEGDEKFEVLTLGINSFRFVTNYTEPMKFSEFQKALDYNQWHLIAEYPCAHDGMGKERLEKLCDEKKLLAVEHNAQIALPDFPFNYLPKFKGYTKSKNEEASEIATRYGIPIIANDDSNGLSHIGTAYTEFHKDNVNFSNGNTILNSLIELIQQKDFAIHRGHLPVSKWLKWTMWDIMFKEKVLGLQDRWD